MKKLLTIHLMFFFFSSFLYSQDLQLVDGNFIKMDKCGFLPESESQVNPTENWGYSYDSLLTDLEIWRQNSYVKVDSIGLSVQGRPLWQLTITSDPNNIAGKRTVYIHARTHPQETEGFWVTKEIIKILLTENSFAQTVRENCVFYIVPMYNPDGVELGYPRRNANNVDLESNWFTFPNEPEVAGLKARFTELMASPNPIEVELNMHSSSLCKRYFVYHDSAGTSPQFAVMQQQFIERVRSYYPTGIEPWNYYVSWTGGNPMKYPESWFWYYHGESVMALTYEDMYQCAGTGNFDLTANAILRGVMDYLNIPTEVELSDNLIPSEFTLEQNYPNPFNPTTKIRYSIPNVGTGLALSTLKVYDILGNEVVTLVNEEKPAGYYEVEFNATELSSGVYFYRLQSDNFTQTKKMILMR
ncbi:Putative carboxypeptidase [Ignavibacterium album JCM 16511]|uniref:Putative carboxypeptidase n=1 Tax=Ignavibacterium album (strain DSM 19864 / JCM 16511 / NBRC 101810 / Mat9-16) TaxID=945713 RepID=I0ANV4_IGNAJ|nr:M14 family zinc carboxypeptidase [Ignavibacterium album]AFH50661.1 Putative carboxypeptidase [Ignavibacterium album JCM 16511]